MLNALQPSGRSVLEIGMRACRASADLRTSVVSVTLVMQGGLHSDCALASACYESYRHFTERDLVAYPVGLAGSSGESFLSVPELPQMLRGPGRVQLGHWANLKRLALKLRKSPDTGSPGRVWDTEREATRHTQESPLGH